MKKTAVLCALTVLSGCSLWQKEECWNELCIDEATVSPAEWEESYPYAYEYETIPDEMFATGAEVIQPRVTEVVSTRQGRPEDGFNIGGGMTVIPDAPEVYVILANRAANTMFKDTEAVFNQPELAKVYVAPVQTAAEDLPRSVGKGYETLVRRLNDNGNTTVVKNKEEAEYVVETSVNWFDTTSKTIPAVRYDIALSDKGGRKIGEWTEVLRRVENDKSWW